MGDADNEDADGDADDDDDDNDVNPDSSLDGPTQVVGDAQAAADKTAQLLIASPTWRPLRMCIPRGPASDSSSPSSHLP